MLRFNQAFSVELPIAVFLGLALVVLHIFRTVRKGRKAGVGWYAGAIILLLVLAVILFLTVMAGSHHPPVPTPVPVP